MTKKDFLEKFYLSITGIGDIAWQNKLKEIEQLGIEEVAVFLTQFEPEERKNFYKSYRLTVRSRQNKEA